MSEPLNANLDKLTEEILASYESDERTHRIGHTFLPSKIRMVEVLDECRQLIFPGFHGRDELSKGNIKYHVGDLLVRLYRDLAEQIYKCLCTDRQCPECGDPEPCHQEAADSASEFLRRIPKIREMLALDAQAAYDGDPAAKSIDEVIYCYPGFYAVTVYRIAHEFFELGVPLMPRIMSEHAHTVTGTDIHPGARIGKSFFIDHATGVVVGETTRIGDNVKIYQGVTLGAMSFPKDERGRVIKGLQRHPTIEDGVTVYANSTILGGKTVIGKGVTIGGNTFVTQSITAQSMVVARTQDIQVKSKKKAEV